MIKFQENKQTENRVILFYILLKYRRIVGHHSVWHGMNRVGFGLFNIKLSGFTSEIFLYCTRYIKTAFSPRRIRIRIKNHKSIQDLLTLTISTNSGLSDAPPTRKPSMSGKEAVYHPPQNASLKSPILKKRSKD